MCTTCKLNNLNPEFEIILHSEYEAAPFPELEGNPYGTTDKNYSSPFLKWFKGSSSKQSSGYAPPFTGYRKPAGIYLMPPSDAQLIKNAIATGERNENNLTDLVFYNRHPELGGQPLSSSHPNLTALSKEWISIRDSIVRPALQTTSTPRTIIPPPSMGGGAGIFLQIPVSGQGYTRKLNNGQTQDQNRVWGHPKVIKALIDIGSKWHQQNPSGPRVQIGDVSFKNGGLMSPHSSHQKGLDVDIRPMRNDGMELPVKYTDSAYSGMLTQQLVDMIRANRVLGIKSILFNGRLAGVQPYAGHDDHLHVSFS